MGFYDESKRRWLAILIAVTTAALSAAGNRSLSAAGKPASNTPASITFRDNTRVGPCITADCTAGDQILSDGNGTYVNEGDRSGQVHGFIRTGGNGNLDFVLALGEQTARTIQVFYTPASDHSQPAGAPSGLLVDNANFGINFIGAMKNGDTKAMNADFHTDLGDFQWGPTPNDPNNDYGSQRLLVTRYDDHTWYASTDASAFGTTGDLAVLVQTVKVKGANTRVVAGHYHMPFAATITCPTCVAPQ
jgi:hypothetical protein